MYKLSGTRVTFATYKVAALPDVAYPVFVRVSVNLSGVISNRIKWAFHRELVEDVQYYSERLWT